MLKVGVFGAGRRGQLHMQQWLDIPGIQLVGFFDPDRKLAQKVSDDLGIRHMDHPEALIQAAEVLGIASPTPTHFQIAKDSLQQSRHLFIEQPMTRTIEEAKALVKLVTEADVKCSIAHVESYQPAIMGLDSYPVVPQYIEACHWVTYNRRSAARSVVEDLMIRDIELILRFVKAPVRRITANGVKVMGSTSDVVTARIEFDNGCTVNLTASRVALKEKRKMRLFQADHYYQINLLDKEVALVRRADRNGLADAATDTFTQPYLEVNPIPVPASSNALKSGMEEFARAIINKQPVKTSVYDGLMAMDIAHQIIQKMTFPAHPA